jgi:putative transposase
MRTAKVEHRTHVARLYPTPAQTVRLDRQGHAARALWNLLHEWQCWRGRGGSIARNPSIAEMDRQVRAARMEPLPGWEWLADLPAQASQQVLKHYVRAWRRFFEGLSGPPRFKRRSSQLAVDLPQASDLRIVRLNHRWGEVSILLVGRVRFRWTRDLPGIPGGTQGRITGARLVKNSLGWHICFRIQEAALAKASNAGPPVGVDRGVVHAMALSDGQNLDMPELLSQGEMRRLRMLELQAARQRSGRGRGVPASKRERATYCQIAALRARQARRRTDWLHKATTRIAESHCVVVVEDLRIANMTRSARGTAQQPGRNVNAKAGLNRSILGMAWGAGERMIDYKTSAQGGKMVKVAAAYSSQTCAECGHVAAENRTSRDSFQCIRCGHAGPADTNAAQVLVERGLAALSGTAPGYGVAGRRALPVAAKKRQPVVGALP